MITDFQAFGTTHIFSILVPIFIGIIWTIWTIKAKTEKQRAVSRITLAAVIVIIRTARYVMDVVFGVFEWSDLFSLHICHVDLILLVLCLIKPNRMLFNFCFLVGIPMALSVALFPGSNHPAPGLPRAVLFIMSHSMLVVGVIYLAITKCMRPALRAYSILAVAGSLALIPLYFINSTLGTNFLYIMRAPKGTVIASLEKLFGWPGYVLALVGIALILMLLMYFIGLLIWKLTVLMSIKDRRTARTK